MSIKPFKQDFKTLSKIILTIKKLIDEHKVVLYVFFRNLAKVGLHHICHLQQELKDHGSVDILFCYSCHPDVGPLK